MGLRPGDPVGREAAVGLKAPERFAGETAENAVGRQLPIARAIERQLQQLHRRPGASYSQNSHFSPSFGHSICAEKRKKNGVFPLYENFWLTFLK